MISIFTTLKMHGNVKNKRKWGQGLHFTGAREFLFQKIVPKSGLELNFQAKNSFRKTAAQYSPAPVGAIVAFFWCWRHRPGVLGHSLRSLHPLDGLLCVPAPRATNPFNFSGARSMRPRVLRGSLIQLIINFKSISPLTRRVRDDLCGIPRFSRPKSAQKAKLTFHFVKNARHSQEICNINVPKLDLTSKLIRII